MRKRAFATALVLFGALAVCGAANAAPPQPVTLSVLTVVADPSDPFTSTGGVVCANGTVSTTFAQFVGGASGTHEQLLVGKHFVCPDGTFDLLLRARLSFDTGATSGTWSVMSGDGAYRLLHGGGAITGTAVVPRAIIDDAYTGRMHVD